MTTLGTLRADDWAVVRARSNTPTCTSQYILTITIRILHVTIQILLYGIRVLIRPLLYKLTDGSGRCLCNDVGRSLCYYVSDNVGIESNSRYNPIVIIKQKSD